MGKRCASHSLLLAIFMFIFNGLQPESEVRAAEDQELQVPAVILRIEGTGNAKIRKSFGTEAVAGANGKIFPGDKVITDDKSTVFLMINDGSVIKVGFSSEFKLESAEFQNRFLSWAFRLVKGSIRAMVEKNPEAEMRFRVHTPSGTIGVRGTEFVAAYDEAAKTSFLYTLEGLVIYGKPACEKDKSCLEIRAGEFTSFKDGDNGPAKPRAYQVKELFGLSAAGAASAAEKPGDSTVSRLSLFRDASRISSVRAMANSDIATLAKMVSDASEELAKSQDRAIGRTKSERNAMHQAIKGGTYGDTMAAADAYSAKKGIFNPRSRGGAENLVAQTAAAKFRLGVAVKDAASAGLFGNGAAKNSDLTVMDAQRWADQNFTLKKNLSYEAAASASVLKQKLASSTRNYAEMLAVAKAAEASVPTTAATVPDVSSSTATATTTDCNEDCRNLTVVDYMSSFFQRLALAFTGTGSLLDHSTGTVAATATSTNTATKTTNGECFEEVKECKLVLCSGYDNGAKCKAGESVQECTTRKVQVACPTN